MFYCPTCRKSFVDPAARRLRSWGQGEHKPIACAYNCEHLAQARRFSKTKKLIYHCGVCRKEFTDPATRKIHSYNRVGRACLYDPAHTARPNGTDENKKIRYYCRTCGRAFTDPATRQKRVVERRLPGPETLNERTSKFLNLLESGMGLRKAAKLARVCPTRMKNKYRVMVNRSKALSIGERLYELIEGMVSKEIPADVRDDLVQEMAAACLSGEFAPEEIGQNVARIRRRVYGQSSRRQNTLFIDHIPAAARQRIEGLLVA